MSKLIIHSDINQFTFQNGEKYFQAEPFCYVTPDSSLTVKVLSEHPADKDTLRYIHLFQEPIIEFNYSRALADFIKFGASKVMGVSLFKPSVHLTFTPELFEYLRGYPNSIPHAVQLALQVQNVTVERVT